MAEAVIRIWEGLYPEKEKVMARLRVPEDLEEDFSDLYGECIAIAAPAYRYRELPVVQEGGITRIGDTPFESRVLRRNMKGVDRCWAYVATCGQALYQKALKTDDPLERYWVDGIAEACLREVHVRMNDEITALAGGKHLSSVNPGSLADFPIQRQGELFRLLGDVEETIGVHLTDTFLMLPYKSGSGYLFAGEQDHVNCALCPREICENRRAPFDEALYEATFAED